MIKSICLALAVSFAVLLLSGSSAVGQVGAIRVGNGLSRWDRPVNLPARAHPINRVLPWYGSGFYYGTWPTWPNYGPGRWDDPYWDGQRRDININVNPPQQTQPAPAPRRTRTPVKPRVIEWNAATGRAEDVNVGRWDEQHAPATAPSQTGASTTDPTSGTSGLSRWDSSSAAPK